MLSTAAKRMFGIGGIVLAVIVIVLGVTKPNPFEETRSIWAEFDSVQGLGAIGRDVRLAGVNVGTIGEVKREGDQALVEIVLKKDFPVHTDARADMRPHTLFEGSSFIDLSPGSPGAPLLADDEIIPVEQTSNYVTLDQALRTLRPEIRESLRDLAETGAKTLRGGTIEGIQKTLKGAPDLLRNLKGPVRSLQGSKRRELAGAISGMSATLEAVATKEDQLIPLAQRLNRTVAAITVDGGAPLDATLAQLPDTLRALRDGAPELTGLVDRLDRFAAEVTPSLPDFTVALHEATPLLERSIPVLEKATPVIADLRVVGRRITAAVPTLTELTKSLVPVVEIFGGSVLPVLLAPSRTGPPTYEQLLATFAAAGGAWRTYQTPAQNPNGAGHQWNIATYIDAESGLSGAFQGQPGSPFPATACVDVAQVSPSAARQIELMGGCR